MIGSTLYLDLEVTEISYSSYIELISLAFSTELFNFKTMVSEKCAKMSETAVFLMCKLIHPDRP